MTKLILHIGDGKCGSTAIQNSLFRSREELARHGILYDTLTPNSGHTTLPLLIGQGSRAATGKRMDLARQTVQLLQDQIPRYEWAILSAENLVNLTADAVTELLEMIGGTAKSAVAIAYVRDPAAMYLSSVQQIIKGSHIYPAPESYHRRIDRKLKNWRKLIGSNRLTVRAFSRASLIEGDVVADLEQWLCTLTGCPVRLERQVANASLTAEQTRVLQIYRQTVFPDMAGTLLSRSTVLVQMFDALNAVCPVGNRIALSEAARKVVSARNADVVANLRELYPELPFVTEECPQEPDETARFPWHETGDVSAILERCDAGLVEDYCRLLPDLAGPDTATEPVEARLGRIHAGFPQAMDQVRAIYGEYLQALPRCKTPPAR